MTPNEPEQFFRTGVQTYYDVRDAITEFEQQVTDRCKKVAEKSRGRIDQVCGTGFWRPTEYNVTSSSQSIRRVGTRSSSRNDVRLFCCLEFRREGDDVVYRPLAFLWRRHMDVADDLWSLREPSTDRFGLRLKEARKLLFGKRLLAAQIPGFDGHLEEAVNEFIDFVKKAGGLAKYFPH